MGCLGTLRGRDTKGEWSTQLGSLTQYIELLTSPIAAHYWVCYEADTNIPIRNLLLIYISTVGLYAWCDSSRPQNTLRQTLFYLQGIRGDKAWSIVEIRSRIRCRIVV